MKNFIRQVEIKAITTRNTVKAKVSDVFQRVRDSLSNNYGQGTLDVAITVLISIVLGALILAGLYLIINGTVLPTITQRSKICSIIRVNKSKSRSYGGVNSTALLSTPCERGD